jgi:hypothetical protein
MPVKLTSNNRYLPDKIAVKVITHLGDEVVKVFRV